MTTISIAFVLAFIVSTVSTLVFRPLAARWGFVDHPDPYRKQHRGPMPRMGGPPILLGFAAPMLGLFLFPHLSQVSRGVLAHAGHLAGLGIGALAVLLCGLLDDRYNLKPSAKLSCEILVGVWMYFTGFTINAVSLPFGGALDLGVFSLPVTVLWFVGCMNAMNLLDGLDGLASGVTVFVSITLFLVSLHFHNTFGMFTMACLGGSALGFLLFNFPPAKIFLGDSGSLLLGFFIAALSLLGASRKAEAAVALLIPIVALGLPILDTALAIVRRWYKRLPLSTPDREHIHHRLVAMGYSPRKAVLTLYVICVGLAGVALIITYARNEVVMMMIVAVLIGALVMARIFSGLGMVDVWNRLRHAQRSGALRAKEYMAVETALAGLSGAGNGDEIWSVCTRFFQDAGLSEVCVRWPGFDRSWMRGDAETGDEWSVRLRLPPSGEIVLRARRPPVLLCEQHDFLENFRTTLAQQLSRVL